MTVGSGLYISGDEQDRTVQNHNIRQLIEGRSNAVGTVTLTANAATTVVSSEVIGASSIPLLMPTTANAAAALATTYVSARAAGSFTLTHANNAQVDKTFYYAAFG